jgi:hypothetical protein
MELNIERNGKYSRQGEQCADAKMEEMEEMQDTSGYRNRMIFPIILAQLQFGMLGRGTMARP